MSAVRNPQPTKYKVVLELRNWGDSKTFRQGFAVEGYSIHDAMFNARLEAHQHGWELLRGVSCATVQP